MEKKSVFLVAVLVIIALLMLNFLIINQLTGYAVKDTEILCFNHPPKITTINELEATVGQPFWYKVTAKDEDGDKLIISDDTPLFEITTNGHIYFTPKTIDIGRHYIKITANDNSHCLNKNSTEIFLLTIKNNETLIEKDSLTFIEMVEYVSEKPKLLATALPIISFILVVIAFLLFLTYRKANRPKTIIWRRTVVRPKTVVKRKTVVKPVIKQDFLGLRRKLMLLKESYQKKFIKKKTYQKSKKKIEKLIKKTKKV